jgi:hypothetical protein
MTLMAADNLSAVFNTSTLCCNRIFSFSHTFSITFMSSDCAGHKVSGTELYFQTKVRWSLETIIGFIFGGKMTRPSSEIVFVHVLDYV